MKDATALIKDSIFVTLVLFGNLAVGFAADPITIDYTPAKITKALPAKPVAAVHPNEPLPPVPLHLYSENALPSKISASVLPPEIQPEDEYYEDQAKSGLRFSSSHWDISLESSFSASADKTQSIVPETEEQADKQWSPAVDASFNLSLEFSPTQGLSAYVDLYADASRDLDSDEPYSLDPQYSRGDAWLRLDASNNDIDRELTIGTQEISDSRGWWWDSDLDLVQYNASAISWQLKTAIGQPFTHTVFNEEIDASEKNTFYWMGEYKWQWRQDQYLSYLVHRTYDRSDLYSESSLIDDFDTDSLDKLTWIGFRAEGTLATGQDESDSYLAYWFDAASLRGRNISYEVEELDDNSQLISSSSQTQRNAWGVDLGVSLSTALPGKPTFNFGYATASFDKDPTDSVDKSFRQTGLHSNESNQIAAGEFGFYGMVLNPDLSNLEVLSVGMSLPIFTDNALHLRYLNFRQMFLTEDWSANDLDIISNGITDDIGNEINVALTLESSNSWEFSLALGIFKAGRAITDLAGNTGRSASVSITYDL